MRKKHQFAYLRVCLTLFSVIGPVSAENWTPTSAPSNYWYAVASSADGSKLFASDSASTVYFSLDSGSTWTPSSMRGVIRACSANGRRVVTSEGIYGSLDSATWYLVGIFPTDFVLAATSSADGSRIAALGDGKIYTSTNSGATWVSNSLPLSLGVLASSADGTKLVGGGGTLGVVGLMAASTDSGATWNLLSPSLNWWHSIASSADGSKLAAYGHWSGVITSADSGATWTSAVLSLNGAQGFLVSSADGSKLLVYGNGMFSSSDSGHTWQSNNVPAEILWTSAAASADGHKLVATAYGGGIWTSQSTPAPQLSITRETTGIRLSWTIPSLPFALQESSDLTSNHWTDVFDSSTIDYTNVHLQYRLALPSQSTDRFYRLANF